MPQASEELRKEWNYDKAVAFLEDAGFELSRDWRWRHSREPTEKEWRAMSYLCDEWDFGGFVWTTNP